jgi:hypothetical protein
MESGRDPISLQGFFREGDLEHPVVYDRHGIPAAGDHLASSIVCGEPLFGRNPDRELANERKTE